MDQRIERGETLERGGDGRRTRRRIRNVAGMKQELVVRRQLVGHTLALDVEGDDVGAAFPQHAGAGEPDAARRPGHQHGLFRHRRSSSAGSGSAFYTEIRSGDHAVTGTLQIGEFVPPCEPLAT